MGILAARLDDDEAVSFEVECPVEPGRMTPNLAHVSWTAGMMSEMCGSFPLYLGVMAFAGTVTTRFVAPVPVGERLIGRATLKGANVGSCSLKRPHVVVDRKPSWRRRQESRSRCGAFEDHGGV